MAAEPPGEPGSEPRPSETLEQLFLALECPLLSYATRLVKDVAMAEDIVQEAFLRLQAHAAEVRDPRSWLYRTAHNLAINHLRSGQRLVSLTAPAEFGLTEGGGGGTGDETSDPLPLPDEQLARWEGIGLVRLGLAALDERSRRVVELKFRENLSYREIARETGLTEGHVGYLLHHALKNLHDDLLKAGLLP